MNNKRREIENLNKRIRDCTACRLSETRNNVLVGEGDLNARLMFISLSPGVKEDECNMMFIGPSGTVLDRLFEAADIQRTSVYMSNLVKCMLPKNRRPKMDEIESCRHFLDEEIEIVDPDIIVPLGFYATRYIMTKFQADPPSARAEFVKFYGQLLYSRGQRIFPLPHPASLIYNPDFEPATMVKYRQLQILSHDCHWFPMCPMKRFLEEDMLDPRWIALYCKGLWHNCVRYQMEERALYHPDWMLPDGSLDEKLKPV